MDARDTGADPGDDLVRDGPRRLRPVLGGGLAAGADLYLDPIKSWFQQLIYQPELRPMPEVAFAYWNEQAGAVGAALLHTVHT